jgi:glycosyltransferase involved in cell wall biosynthesis
MKIGIVIPTKDRPEFLEHAKYLLSLQTRQPDVVEIVDDVTDLATDITWRYRHGVERILAKGVDVILFWEDDDYYLPCYIEEMIKGWERSGKPDIFGHVITVYYHIVWRMYSYRKHRGRASMMNTMITKEAAQKITWCNDTESFTDLHLWNILKGVSIDAPQMFIGIKHGTGTCVTHGHSSLELYGANDEDYEYLKGFVKDKRSIDFYTTFKAKTLTAIYNVYNGIELLRGSIEQIKEYFTDLILVYQNISNWGEEKDTRSEILEAMKGYEKEYKIVEYVPKQNKTPKENEIDKRNLGLKHVKTNYFICMDCDEYYFRDEFKNAFEFIHENNIDSSLCRLKTYIKKPTLQLKQMEDYYVPFIMRKYPDTKMGRFPMTKLVDPSRGVNTQKKTHVFEPEQITMQHYSWVRKDIKNKLMNASARVNFDHKIDKYLHQYDTMKNIAPHFGTEVISVPNYFRIEF